MLISKAERVPYVGMWMKVHQSCGRWYAVGDLCRVVDPTGSIQADFAGNAKVEGDGLWYVAGFAKPCKKPSRKEKKRRAKLNY